MQIPVLIPFILVRSRKTSTVFSFPLRLLNRDILLARSLPAYLVFFGVFGARDSTCTVKCAFRMHLKWYHGTKAAAACLMFFGWARIEQWAINGKVYSAIANTEHTPPQTSKKQQCARISHWRAALTMCMCFYVCMLINRFESARFSVISPSFALCVFVSRTLWRVAFARLPACLPACRCVCIVWYIFQRFRLRIKAIPKRDVCLRASKRVC